MNLMRIGDAESLLFIAFELVGFDTQHKLCREAIAVLGRD